MNPYQYLPKQMKEAVDSFDVDTVDYFLKWERYSELAYMIHIIIQSNEAGKPMSQIHQEALEYVSNKWGKDTPRVLKAMRDLMWDDIKAGKYKKQPPVPREVRIAERDAALSIFDTKVV